MILSNLTPVLAKAASEGYGVGSFSARSTYLIEAVLDAAQAKNSPVIVQISANEFGWFGITPAQFAKRFYEIKDRYSIPAVLHLDHTRDVAVIRDATDAGFTSVMIDQSAQPFEENARITREVVELAHPRGVSVEAELGSIGGADKLETGEDKTLYTDPEQARLFVEQTGVDALAVSIGSAHGVYPVKNPKLDFDRLRAIRELVCVPLVLHGGSGLPEETVKRAISLDGKGGVTKINIATDLELCFRKVLGEPERLTNAQIDAISPERLAPAGKAVQALVEDRIENYVMSAGRA